MWHSLFVQKAHAVESALKIDATLPGVTDTGNPLEFVRGIYTFALTASGILALSIIIYAAIKYSAAQGNPSKQGDARDQITQAFLGILLLFGVYLIFFTINPDLVNLQLPSLDALKVNKIAANACLFSPCGTDPTMVCVTKADGGYECQKDTADNARICEEECRSKGKICVRQKQDTNSTKVVCDDLKVECPTDGRKNAQDCVCGGKGCQAGWVCKSSGFCDNPDLEYCKQGELLQGLAKKCKCGNQECGGVGNELPQSCWDNNLPYLLSQWKCVPKGPNCPINTKITSPCLCPPDSLSTCAAGRICQETFHAGKSNEYSCVPNINKCPYGAISKECLCYKTPCPAGKYCLQQGLLSDGDMCVNPPLACPAGDDVKVAVACLCGGEKFCAEGKRCVRTMSSVVTYDCK